MSFDFLLFTDGACSGNPGPGGWGWLRRDCKTGDVVRSSGAEHNTTNNRMEMSAVINGLESMPGTGLKIKVITDSNYVVKGVTEWMKGWKSRGWKRNEGGRLKPVMNVDLWQRLDELLALHQVKCEWIKGHAGHAENEECDRLAVRAIESLSGSPPPKISDKTVSLSSKTSASNGIASFAFQSPSATVCAVPAMHRGPFLFCDKLEKGLDAAKSNGFANVELFIEDPTKVKPEKLSKLINERDLKVTTFGSGAGFVCNGWTLTHTDASVRKKAIDYLKQTVELAGPLGAHVIVGSMQGRAGEHRKDALKHLADGLREVSQFAEAEFKTTLLFEPLNRYETDLFNHLATATEFLKQNRLDLVGLLADLFHMNIEEANPCKALIDAGNRVKHVHLADSNRHAIGTGHANLPGIVQSLKQLEYKHTFAIECFANGDPVGTAKQAQSTFTRLFK